MQWFCHGVLRLPECSFVNITYKHDFDGKRPKGRPPKRWSDQLRSNTGLPLLTTEIKCQDREKMRHEECGKAIWSMHLSQVSQVTIIFYSYFSLKEKYFEKFSTPVMQSN